VAKSNAINLDDTVPTAGAATVADFDTPLDFTKIRGNEPIPRNEYYLEVMTAEPKMSKGDPSQGRAPAPKASARIKVLNGAFEGRSIFEDFSFSPGALPITKALLAGMGIPEDSNLSVREVCEEMIGRRFYAIVDIKQSDKINSSTNKPYDPKNRIVRTSLEPKTNGESDLA
jgi:hypothetical protein